MNTVDEKEASSTPAVVLGGAPDNPRALDSFQLEALTKAFREWREKPKRNSFQLARGRIWLIYLALRYTGAKLGEVLKLDDRTDIDLDAGVVTFMGDGEASARKVRIPDAVVGELRSFFSQSAVENLRGRVFRLDQGHVRKKFYERAIELGLPRELANPSVLRRSRAMELLRENVPLTVVQSIFGQSSASLTAAYVNFSEQDVERIVDRFVQRESGRKTSARNSFSGRVTRIVRGDVQSEVEVTTPTGNAIQAIITTDSLDTLDMVRGKMATAVVKAPSVLLAADGDRPRNSARNKFRGTVVKLTHGKVASDVTLEINDGTLVHAIMTRTSAKALGLNLGDSAWAMFKAFAVILNVD
jgi:molybdate transport system regulatory protein